jgi:hypothetical protein
MRSAKGILLAGVLGHSPNGFDSFCCVDGKLLLGDLGGSATPFIHDLWFSLSALAAAWLDFFGDFFVVALLLLGTYWKPLNFDREVAEIYGVCFVDMIAVQQL